VDFLIAADAHQRRKDLSFESHDPRAVFGNNPTIEPVTPMRKTTIITDPVHQVMNFGSDESLKDCLRDVIDTREFQRLRRITQLGLASYVFPGATHTRFSHSLGVAHLAHSVLAHLSEWAEGETRNDVAAAWNEVVLAGLLHDVGHGPFSHSFEQILKNYPWAPLHEDWTAALITDPSSTIYQRLESHGLDANNIASAITKAGDGSLDRPFRQIVSSQIDVDRMDYLLRDSHFAGVAVGQFDAHYLINSMIIVEHSQAGSQRTLGLTPKGVKAYEAFLLARQLMNRTVYYHHNVKVLEFMAEQVLRLAIDNVEMLNSDKTVATIVPPYFQRVHAALKSGAVSKQAFIKQSLGDYVRLTEDAAWVLIAALADQTIVPAAQMLAQRLLTRSILPHYRVEPGKKDLLKESLQGASFQEGVDFQIIDVKTTMYKGTGEEGVFVVDWDGSIEEVAELSDTITAFRDRPEAESLLVIINDTATSPIKTVATQGQFVQLATFAKPKEVVIASSNTPTSHVEKAPTQDGSR
jgi:HD superfamily phosphohydrolase